MTIGERIKAARKAADITQTELATRMNVTQSMIGQYERGIRIPKYETLKRIASALGVTVETLAGKYMSFESGEEFTRYWNELQLKEKNGLRESIAISHHSDGTYTIEMKNTDQTTYEMIEAYSVLHSDDRNKVKTYTKDLSLKPEYSDHQ